MRGKAYRGSDIEFGDFGMQAVECGFMSARQIEAARIAITRHVKKGVPDAFSALPTVLFPAAMFPSNKMILLRARNILASEHTPEAAS